MTSQAPVDGAWDFFWLEAISTVSAATFRSAIAIPINVASVCYRYFQGANPVNTADFYLLFVPRRPASSGTPPSTIARQRTESLDGQIAAGSGTNLRTIEIERP